MIWHLSQKAIVKKQIDPILLEMNSQYPFHLSQSAVIETAWSRHMRLKGSVECVPKRAMLCLCCIYSHEQGAQIVIKNLPGPREAWPLKNLQWAQFTANKTVCLQ